MQNFYTPCRPLMLVCMLWCVFLEGGAQDRCGMVEVMQNLRRKRSVVESDDQFESWMKQQRAGIAGRANAAQKFRIPVVVHVIHRGEATGVGTNISDAQIISQINVLNKDFNRTNADASGTPSEFLPVAGSLNIEFVLAAQSPEGQETNGIVRVKGSKTQWSSSDDATLKALSYWPAEDYLNIWVTNLSSSLLGYAQFPVSDLEGLEDASTNRLTDGVVIDYAVFGSSDDGSFSLLSDFNKGRTTTHEVGHFLGLRHIWGDDGTACGGSGDYVSDTPDQGGSTSGCPSSTLTSCSVHTMFQNYMDYTDDACMNLFTQEQVDRMVTVLENSPRRVTLSESKGLTSPIIYTRNLEITEITNPTANVCAGEVLPQVVLKNTGEEDVTAASIRLRVNNTVTETREITFDAAIGSLETTTVSFSSITLLPGDTDVLFEIVTVNGAADENQNDDLKTITAAVPYTIAVPFSESFAVMPSQWKVINADEAITWSVKQAPHDDASNTSAYLNFFNDQNTESQTDVLVTPVFDLSNATAPYLTFDVAYARRSSSNDGLKVFIITDCSDDISKGTQLYSKSGSALATASSTSTAFTPSGKDQWRKEIVNLGSYIGQPHVQLAFAGISDGGNNLYVDNISVVSSITENIAVTKVVAPSPVRCESVATPALVVKNNSSIEVTSLNVVYSLNGGTQQTFAAEDLSGFSPGTEITITLPSLDLADGENILYFELTSPNGYTDIDPADNESTTVVVVNAASNIIPLREDFNGSFEDLWTVVNPAEGMRWTTASTNYDQSMYFNAAGNTTVGDEAWLVSPVLDLSSVSSASVFFDLAYRYASGSGSKSTPDNLRVLASTDCGVTYSQVLYDERGESLSTIGNESARYPVSQEQWKKNYLNLTGLTGGNSVRIAFVFTNGNGSDIYLDNIEFFTSSDPDPQSVHQPFEVYGTDAESPSDFYITFNLPERQAVSYEVVDAMGRHVTGDELSDVLNQTYRVYASYASAGIYILRLQIGKKYYAAKVYMGK